MTCIENVFNGESADIKKLGEVIKWVMNDVLKEEIDFLCSETGVLYLFVEGKDYTDEQILKTIKRFHC